MKAFSSGWLHTLPQDQVGATNLLLQLLCRLNISIVRSAAFSILHCDFTEVETTRCDARVALLIRHFSIHLHQKKWLLNERIEFWSNRHLTHAEKSDPIAEWIIPKAVELQALPTGQCFIVSCICHSTVHTFVTTVYKNLQNHALSTASLVTPPKLIVRTICMGPFHLTMETVETVNSSG